MSDEHIYPECAICGGSDVKLVHDNVSGLRIVKCNSDELVFFRPNAAKKLHDEFLKSSYWVAPSFADARQSGNYDFNKYLALLNDPNAVVIGYPDYIEPEHLRAKVSWGRRAMQWFIRYAMGQELKTVMDIGCATGHMLQGFVEVGGFDFAAGVDVSPYIIEKGKDLLSGYIREGQLELWCGEVWDYPCPRQIDCVILWDSLEHIQEVNKAMEYIKSITSPKALMIVHTPDANQAGNKEWPLWSPKQHCWIFSRATLDIFLGKYGFNWVAQKVSPEAGEMLNIYQKVV